MGSVKLPEELRELIRTRALTALAAVVTFALSVIMPTGAIAAPYGCTPSGYHCYAIYRMGPLSHSGYGLKGAAVVLKAYCLDVPSPSANFVTQTLWVIDFGGGNGAFLETGMAYGYPQGATDYFYWTHNGIEEDFAWSPTLGDEYTAAITYTSGGTWHIQINGINAYQSGLPASVYYLNAGTESTHDNPHVFGAVKTMAFFNSAGDYHLGWDYPGHVAQGQHFPSSPSYGYLNWVNTYTAGEDGDTSSC